MIFGLILAVWYFRKPREYAQIAQNTEIKNENPKMTYKEFGVLIGVIATFIVQILSSSMPLAALIGIIIMIATRGIEYKKMDEIFNGGVHMMGFIAFIMLVAAGYGAVIRETGGIAELVNFVANFADGRLAGAILMLVIGLFVTMGIGTSFGTIPIIAAIYCPLSAALGFSIEATILLIGIAAAVGDAGSPASDSTLGPTAGLNADEQHNHIWDTCVPTFVFYNIPLIVFGTIFAMFL